MTQAAVPLPESAYPELAALTRRTDPDHPLAPETLRAEKTRLREGEHLEYLGVRAKERLRAAAQVRVEPSGRARFKLYLPEAAFGQGLEDALWTAACQTLARAGARQVVTALPSTRTAALEYFTRLGFREADRMHESRLDLTRFNPTAFAAVLERTQTRGYALRSLAEYGRNEAHERALYALTLRLLRDVPSREPLDPWPFEVWRSRALAPETLLPELWMLAQHNGRVVGLSQLLADPAQPQRLRTGLTGVLPQARGQGLATALKVAALTRAKARGYREVRTVNHAVNARMLGINQRLGFERQPPTILLVLEGPLA